jgi:predicted nucleic acid-binding protein
MAKLVRAHLLVFAKVWICAGHPQFREMNCTSDKPNFMTEKYFVDTNILIYAHDRAAGEKHECARRLLENLWATGQGVLSTQVLQELCVNLQRKLVRPLPIEEIRRLLNDYLSWEVVVPDPPAILQALDHEARYKISFWDGLILQAAEQAGASVVYSEDLAAGQRYGTVQVVNPFK